VTRREKRLQRIERNPRNVSRKDLISLVEAYGFVRRGGKGSHTCYKHPGLPEVKLTIPTALKVAYVKQVLETIYRVREIDEHG